MICLTVGFGGPPSSLFALEDAAPAPPPPPPPRRLPPPSLVELVKTMKSSSAGAFLGFAAAGAFAGSALEVDADALLGAAELLLFSFPFFTIIT